MFSATLLVSTTTGMRFLRCRGRKLYTSTSIVQKINSRRMLSSPAVPALGRNAVSVSGNLATKSEGWINGLRLMIYSATKRSSTAGGVPLVWTQSHANVAKWVLGTSGMVVGMIHIGGLTRLTMSGLSMTTWSPLGSLPPITREEWEKEFDRYKNFPEWQQRKSMTLSEFKYIYAWEYGHRMLGRCVGMVFMLPWMYYTARGKIPKGYQKNMTFLALLGGTQGAVGWWMVKSGLGEDRRDDRHQIRVRPVRLAAHLTMAFSCYGALLWTGWDMLRLPSFKAENITQLFSRSPKIPKGEMESLLRQGRNLRNGAMVVTGLTTATIISGALVAGNDAGRAYNTWPRMTDDDWIAPDVWSFETDDDGDRRRSIRHLLTENTATTQFNHRMLGQATGVTALGLVASVSRLAAKKAPFLTPQVCRGLVLMATTATAQAVLGIVTILNYVPISLAALHQMGSVVVLTSSLYVVHSLKFIKHPALTKFITTATTTAASTSSSAIGAIRRTPVVAAETNKRLIITKSIIKK